MANKMIWTEDHEIYFLREVLTEKPFDYPRGSKEAISAWTRIEVTLRNCNELNFFVNIKSLRDHLNYQIKKRNRTLRDEERASGIEVETSEMDVLLDEISNGIEIANEIRTEKLDMNKKKEEAEKLKAEEIRNQAMESMGETRRRRSSEDSETSGPSFASPPPPKRRGTETLAYLREVSEAKRKQENEEKELRREELAFQTRQHEESTRQTQLLLQQMQQQQALQNAALQQQLTNQQQQFQMQTELFKSLIDKINHI